LSSLPKALLGFEHVNRYWDKRNKAYAAKILPGEYFVTKSNEIITTVLGSCVSACIRDPINQIGGMNHFLLPLTNDEIWSSKTKLNSLATRYGNFAMEHMINDILKYGGVKKNLEIKIFGGSRIMQAMTDIGKSNIDFVKSFLILEGFDLKAEDVGGINPRKVLYNPLTGKVRVKKLKDLHNDTIIKREVNYKSKLSASGTTGDVDLFE